MAVVTHTIHQYLRIMKKLENPKWEESREYLRNTILPCLQEIQRDLFGNEELYFEIDMGRNGEYVSVFINVSGKKYKDNLFLCLSCVCSREKIDSDYYRIASFIKKYIA